MGMGEMEKMRERREGEGPIGSIRKDGNGGREKQGNQIHL